MKITRFRKADKNTKNKAKRRNKKGTSVRGHQCMDVGLVVFSLAACGIASIVVRTMCVFFSLAACGIASIVVRYYVWFFLTCSMCVYYIRTIVVTL